MTMMLRFGNFTILLFVGFLIYSIQGAPTDFLLLEKDGKNPVTCALCNELVNVTFRGFENDLTDEDIADLIGDVCVRANIYTYKTCYGTALLAMPTLRYISTLPDFEEGNFCGTFLPGQDCPLSDPSKVEWIIPPSSVPKPPVTLPTPPPQGAPTLKVLHLADIHWDPEYLEGSLANCNDALCCRSSSGIVTTPSDGAGYWGDYRTCDSPWRTIEKAMAHIARLHPDIDHIVWTGDLVPHDTFDTSKEENIFIMDQLFNVTRTYFPRTPIFATLGNHESSPFNVFAPPEITDPEYSTQWLYDAADYQWSKLVPNMDISATTRFGGYYTTLARPGLRIVSMNNNYCYTNNWWTMYKSKDPASGLAWLKGVLEQAERSGEKVHVLSHIPPGNRDCDPVFSREFAKIINRFEGTVAAQFYGHTHNEEYKVFYDYVETNRPVNVAFIGGSLTTYSRLNPSYRIYTIDGQRTGSSYAVLNFETWYMDLVASNNAAPTADPIWARLYDAKSEYALTDLSPVSMNSLFEKMLSDRLTFDLYFKNFHKNVAEVVSAGCNRICRSDILCSIVTTDYHDRSRCDQIRSMLH